METDKTLAYQRKVEALYANEAAANFKREYFPADPFDDGVLVDAAYLDIKDLTAIYRAVKALEREGHQPFVNCLILSRDNAHLAPMVRVNPLFIDACRQRKIEVCELLQGFFYGTCRSFADKRQQIVDMGDAQLLEYLTQVEEALNLTPEQMEVIVDSHTISIEK